MMSPTNINNFATVLSNTRSRTTLPPPPARRATNPPSPTAPPAIHWAGATTTTPSHCTNHPTESTMGESYHYVMTGRNITPQQDAIAAAAPAYPFQSPNPFDNLPNNDSEGPGIDTQHEDGNSQPLIMPPDVEEPNHIDATNVFRTLTNVLPNDAGFAGLCNNAIVDVPPTSDAQPIIPTTTTKMEIFCYLHKIMEKLTQKDSRVNNIGATLKGLLLPIRNDISALGSCMDDMAKDTDTIASTLCKKFRTSLDPLCTNLTTMHDRLNKAMALKLTTANVSATICREVDPS